jgi:hypothetical protein
VLDRDFSAPEAPRTPIQPYAVTLGLLAALQGRSTLDASTVTGTAHRYCSS